MQCHAISAVRSQALEMCLLRAFTALKFSTDLLDVSLAEALANGLQGIAYDRQQAEPPRRDIGAILVTSTSWHPAYATRSSTPAAAVPPPCNGNAPTATRSRTICICSSDCIVTGTGSELSCRPPRNPPAGCIGDLNTRRMKNTGGNSTSSSSGGSRTGRTGGSDSCMAVGEPLPALILGMTGMAVTRPQCRSGMTTVRRIRSIRCYNTGCSSRRSSGGAAARRPISTSAPHGATAAAGCSYTTTTQEAEPGDGGSGGGGSGQCGDESDASSDDIYDDTSQHDPPGSATAGWSPDGQKGRPPDPAAAAAAAATALTDLTRPASWYPVARGLKRKVVAHLGPTNSGKTHAALQALKAAPSGMYCGPLRLLACEVADRLAAEGLPCNLVTGQEVRRAVGARGAPARHTACTIEMAEVTTRLPATGTAAVDRDCSGRRTSGGGGGDDEGGGDGSGDGGGGVARFDVVVLDEIQMLGDRLRGWAWTRALLGLAAREVHVAGDSAVLPVLRALVAECGDELQV
ncbi:hypothetical protein Vretimale_13239 [Volvox reticuliferus]|nr:hypothetical protein Vretimale_13239 [Volvox reticuliferus]